MTLKSERTLSLDLKESADWAQMMWSGRHILVRNLWMLSTVQTVLSRETSRATHFNSKRLQGQQQWVIKRLLFCSQTAPEAISEGQKSENFLGSMPPDHPTTGTLRALLCFRHVDPPFQNPRSALICNILELGQCINFPIYCACALASSEQVHAYEELLFVLHIP